MPIYIKRWHGNWVECKLITQIIHGLYELVVKE